MHIGRVQPIVHARVSHRQNEGVTAIGICERLRAVHAAVAVRNIISGTPYVGDRGDEIVSPTHVDFQHDSVLGIG